MEFTHDLESGSSPRIRRAAQNIAKKQLDGYCPFLLEALTREIEKPKAWETQCALIKALGITHCEEALPVLENLIGREYEATVLYRELAFSIFILRNSSGSSLDFLFRSIEKGNALQIGGACSAILHEKIIPSRDEIKRIIAGIAPHTENEGRIITPRCYIAAVAYLWPKDETQAFLESCMHSKWPGLVEIAQDALQGKKPRMQLA